MPTETLARKAQNINCLVLYGKSLLSPVVVCQLLPQGLSFLLPASRIAQGIRHVRKRRSAHTWGPSILQRLVTHEEEGVWGLMLTARSGPGKFPNSAQTLSNNRKTQWGVFCICHIMNSTPLNKGPQSHHT